MFRRKYTYPHPYTHPPSPTPPPPPPRYHAQPRSLHEPLRVWPLSGWWRVRHVYPGTLWGAAATSHGEWRPRDRPRGQWELCGACHGHAMHRRNLKAIWRHIARRISIEIQIGDATSQLEESRAFLSWRKAQPLRGDYLSAKHLLHSQPLLQGKPPRFLEQNRQFLGHSQFLRPLLTRHSPHTSTCDWATDASVQFATERLDRPRKPSRSIHKFESVEHVFRCAHAIRHAMFDHPWHPLLFIEEV